MFKDMKLSVKVGLGFIVIVILGMIIGIMSVASLTEVGDNSKKAELTNNIMVNLLSARRYTLGYQLNKKDEYLDTINQEFKKTLEVIDNNVDIYKDINKREKIMMMKQDIKKLDGKIKEVVSTLKEKHNHTSGTSIYNELQKQEDELAKEVNDLSYNIIEEAKRMRDLENEDMHNEMKFSKYRAIGLVIIVVIAGVLLSIIIVMSITKKLKTLIDKLSRGANQVTVVSENVAAASEQLAAGSTEQATSIEETSATLEESSSMIKQNTENTQEATVLSKETMDASKKGNTEMQKMMESMIELKKSSDDISKIIKVIDDIAFQTNILALNAAVEAARAGDAGMGFAVVAEEVRNLAQRSADAAKNTSNIIGTNIDLADKCVDVSGNVKDSLEDMNVKAEKVSELLEEIAAASQEQSQGIVQINDAMVQMEKVIQQNSESAIANSDSASNLLKEAETMRNSVNELVRLVNGSHGLAEEVALSARDNVLSRKKNKINKVRTSGNKYKSKIKPNEVIPLDEDTSDF